jgi:hypothetical protein
VPQQSEVADRYHKFLLSEIEDTAGRIGPNARFAARLAETVSVNSEEERIALEEIDLALRRIESRLRRLRGL